MVVNPHFFWPRSVANSRHFTSNIKLGMILYLSYETRDIGFAFLDYKVKP